MSSASPEKESKASIARVSFVSMYTGWCLWDPHQSHAKAIDAADTVKACQRLTEIERGVRLSRSITVVLKDQFSQPFLVVADPAEFRKGSFQFS